MFEMVKLFFLEMKCSTNNSHSPDESNIVISGQLHAYACLCMSILHLSSMQRQRGLPLLCISSCWLSGHVAHVLETVIKALSTTPSEEPRLLCAQNRINI